MSQVGDTITIVSTQYVVSQIKHYPNRKNPICSRVTLKRNGRHHEIASFMIDDKGNVLPWRVGDDR